MVLIGLHPVNWRSEHAARSETGVRRSNRTPLRSCWGRSVLDFAGALMGVGVWIDIPSRM
jgi:hypothetical protein